MSIKQLIRFEKPVNQGVSTMFQKMSLANRGRALRVLKADALHIGEKTWAFEPGGRC